MEPRRVVLVAFPGVQSLDLTGPLEVFSTAARVRPAAYRVEVVAGSAGPIRCWSGLVIVPDLALAGCGGPIDTLLIAGGEGVRDAVEDEHLVRWLVHAAARSRRVGSVCSGAFLLAQAGLLDGRRATTHWSEVVALARSHPLISVEPDSIYVHDGPFYTSAGVSAGIDLSLALVEEDLGPRVALEVARWLVVFARRSGGQTQFSPLLRDQAPAGPLLRDLQAWITDNLDAGLTVEALARRMMMSPRNFARVFRREFGTTPAVYVESARVERARLLLETTEHPVDAVARRCGFGTVETMRRAFARRLRVSPSAYRSCFAAHVKKATT